MASALRASAGAGLPTRSTRAPLAPQHRATTPARPTRAFASRPTVGFLEALDDGSESDGTLAAPPVPSTAPVGDAVAAAARAAGRAPTAADLFAADRLAAAGLTTAGDLAGLTRKAAAALGVPADVAARAAGVVGAAPRKARAARAARAAAPRKPAPATTLVTASRQVTGIDYDRLTGAAAASASRTLAAPPADPRWADRAGDPPGPADDAVRAILARRMPRQSRNMHGDGAAVRVTARRAQEPYALAAADAGPALAADLASFHRFWTARFPGQQQPPIQPVTAAKYGDHVRRALGWMAATRCVDPAKLTLKDLVPSPTRDGAAPAMEYAAWLAAERRVSPHTEGLAVRALLAAAKHVWHAESTARPADGDKPYSDLAVVRELRAMSKGARAAARTATRVADESAKWLEWGEYLDLVAELKSECAALEERGRARAPAAVAWSLQKYLMFAVLASVPDRQRTLRELEVGRTLFFHRGRWEIRHGAGDYKTGRAYGDRPPLVLSPALNPELAAYLSTYRATLAPRHNYVFTARGGGPLTGQAVHRLFERAAFRVAGKKLNPHLVRDMIVTHLRGRGDATERELEALALYMGHSLAMQRGTYDRRSTAAKVEPAVALLERLSGREGEERE